MFLAGHLPTQTFSLAEMQKMPQYLGPEWKGLLAPKGPSLWKDDRGKLVVVCGGETFSDYYAVRPIIRVPSRVQ